MKKSRYSDSQILAILKQHEVGVPVADLSVADQVRRYGCLAD